ncbi:MAG TPA: carbohydrate binding domain-containing protein, partial [Acidimicrobiales bacterium]
WVSLRPASAVQLSGNILKNVVGAPDGSSTLTGDPLFIGRGTATGHTSATGYQVHQTSPAIGAGQSIAQNGGRDMYGNPVPASGPVNIGAYQGPGTTGSTPPAVGPAGGNLVTNGTFETGTVNPWVTSWWTVTSGTGHASTYAARLNASSSTTSAQIYETVNGLTPNGVYLVSGWVIAPDGINTSFGVQAFQGIEGPNPQATSTVWWHYSKGFQLGPSATSVQVFCHRGGTPPLGNPSCDDLSLIRIG